MQQTLWYFDDDAENIGTRKRVTAGVVETGGRAPNDLVKLVEIEEEGIVAGTGEQLDAVVAGGDDRMGAVGRYGYGTDEGAFFDLCFGTRERRACRAVEVHAPAGINSLNDKVFHIVPVVVDLELDQCVGVELGGCGSAWGEQALRVTDKNKIVCVLAFEYIEVCDVGGLAFHGRSIHVVGCIKHSAYNQDRAGDHDNDFSSFHLIKILR
jgi:hypothetical protein